MSRLSGFAQVYGESDTLVATVCYSLGVTRGASNIRQIRGEIYVTEGERNLRGITLLRLKLGPTSEARFTLIASDPERGHYTIQLARAPDQITI